MKKCTKCKKEKEINIFYSYKKVNSKGEEYTYCFPYCKECQIEKSQKSTSNNYNNHLEALRRNNARSEVKGKMAANSKKQRGKGYLRNWQIKNPEKIRRYRKNHQTHNITKIEWENCKKYFDYCCAYCGFKEENHIRIFNQQLHKEHFHHNGSNDLSNCVPSCKNCNSSKGTKIFEDWYRGEEWRKKKIYEWLNRDYVKAI